MADWCGGLPTAGLDAPSSVASAWQPQRFVRLALPERPLDVENDPHGPRFESSSRPSCEVEAQRVQRRSCAKRKA